MTEPSSYVVLFLVPDQFFRSRQRGTAGRCPEGAIGARTNRSCSYPETDSAISKSPLLSLVNLKLSG